MKKRKAVHSPWIWFLGVCIAAIPVLLPLFHRGFYISDDGEWMVIRLSAFYQSLASGQFPVRFLGRLNNSYGYPVANFLYPGFMYIGSLLRIAGISFPDAVKLIMGGSVVASALLLFAALRRAYGALSSFIGTLGFLYAPYVSYDLYTRGSVGEVLAFLPGALLVYAVAARAGWLIAPSIAFLIVSHNTTAVVFGAAFGALLIMNRKFVAGFWHGVTGIGMAAFFWLPAVVERVFVQFDSVSVSDPTQHFVTAARAALLGLPVIVAIALSLGFHRKRRPWNTAVLAVILTAYALALPISTFVWNWPLFSRFVQFPYRFLVLPVLLGPWIIACVFDTLSGWKRAAFLLVSVPLWILPLVSQLAGVRYVDRPIGYYTTNEATTTVADEYMPRWVSKRPIERSYDVVEVIDGNVNLSERRFPKELIVTTVTAKTEGIVQINKIYYPGWRVALDGQLVMPDYKNEFGFMRITVPEGTHELKAIFRETPFRLIADVISLGAVLLYAVFLKRLSRNV